ncbi:NAD(P)H-binding protein [bacterium]|nr:NAD(P)H-binding protein [bacterium]
MLVVPLPRRILLLGASSHTGERVARRLARHGVHVRAMTRDTKSPIAQGLAAARCEIVEGDANRRWKIWEALEGCDAMVSCSHIRHAEVCIQACHRVGVERLVCMSSTRRFSTFKTPDVNEVMAAEALLTECDREWTIIRPTMIFGGRRDDNITRLVKWTSRHTWFPVFGKGNNLVQPVFVEDLVDALVETLRRPDTSHHDYTLGGPEAIEYNDFIRQIAEAQGRAIRLVHVPLKLAMWSATVMPNFLRPLGVTPDVIRRMQEDKNVGIDRARDDLDFNPRPFSEAMSWKISGNAEVEAIYPTEGGQAWSASHPD